MNTPFIVPLPLRTVLFNFGHLSEAELENVIQEQQLKQQQLQEDVQNQEQQEQKEAPKEDKYTKEKQKK